jgi:hypothetical protein
MKASRFHYVTAVGVIATTGLLLLLALPAASTGAAMDTTEATAGTAVRGRIVISCEGSIRNMPPRSDPHGFCTVSGAIDDAGRFADSALQYVRPRVRVLFLTKGTVWISVYRERHGHWKILSATRAYSGLRGHGWEKTTPQVGLRVTPGCCSVSLKMTGTVFQSDTR